MRSMDVLLIGSDGLRPQPRRREKNLLDRQVEKFSDAKGEWERRVVFAGLYGVNALPRDFELLRQILLAPAALGAEDAKAVLHQQPPSPSVSLLTIPPRPSPANQIAISQ